MVGPVSKLPLLEVTAIARDVVGRHHYEVVGTVPAQGDSEYAELVVALSDGPGSSTISRLTIGIHRRESPEGVREQIERGLRAHDQEAR